MWHTLRELQPPKEIKMRENETTSWELRHLVTTFNLFQLPLVSQHYPSLRHLVYKVRKLSHNSKYFHAHHGRHYLLLHPILEHRLPLVHLEWSGQHTIFFLSQLQRKPFFSHSSVCTKEIFWMSIIGFCSMIGSLIGFTSLLGSLPLSCGALMTFLHEVRSKEAFNKGGFNILSRILI